MMSPFGNSKAYLGLDVNVKKSNVRFWRLASLFRTGAICRSSVVPLSVLFAALVGA